MDSTASLYLALLLLPLQMPLPSVPFVSVMLHCWMERRIQHQNDVEQQLAMADRHWQKLALEPNPPDSYS